MMTSEIPYSLIQAKLMSGNREKRFLFVFFFFFVFVFLQLHLQKCLIKDPSFQKCNYSRNKPSILRKSKYLQTDKILCIEITENTALSSSHLSHYPAINNWIRTETLKFCCDMA